MLQVLRALRRLERRDAEPPEDLEPTLFVLDLFRNWDGRWELRASNDFLHRAGSGTSFLDHTGSEIFLGERSAHRSLLWLFVSGWSRIGGHPL